MVAPHSGSIGRARKMANFLQSSLALVDERKWKENDAEPFGIIGNVKGKQAIIIDDLIATGTTVSLAARALAENGAESIYACCTHPILTGKAVEKIEFSLIKELIVTNTIQLPQEKAISKIKTISVAPLLAEAIDRIHHEKPVSPLFE